MITRPTKFDPKTFLSKLESYLKEKQDKPEIVKDGRGASAVHYKVNLPTIPDFCKSIGITKMTLYNWRDWTPTPEEKKDKSASWKIKRKEAVLVAFDRLLTEQLTRLLNGGLSGDYNATITKLVLSNNHGMAEKIDNNIKEEVTHTFDDAQIGRIAERIASRR